MSRRLSFALSAALLASVIAAPQAHAATTITDLGGLPGSTGSGAAAINDSGVAVGTSNRAGFNRPVKYDGAGVTELAGPADRHTQLEAINNNGLAAGTATGTSPDVGGRALRYNADGTYAVLSVPFGFWSAAAVAIDDVGTVYGTAAGRDNDREIPVRWRPNGVLATLKLPEGATRGRVTGASPNGYATGVVSGPGMNRLAVRWNPGGTVTTLQRLEDGAESAALAVNRNGDVVGTAEFWNEGSFGVRWNLDGSMTKFGPNLTPWSINDHGVTVGWSTTPNQNVPYRWSNEGEELDLGFPSGTQFAYARDINNAGVIVGYGGATACKWTVS
ncbi:hypothetical protein SK854_43180 [Lentzea sp. BCCO 10_0061]|uniref:Uncharacterized protein n=1 Tax=Lentzea sokolovensis TaxID=3095429 RepID=A0ABU4VDK7_9PSEU|nr:hypothetical protein [Lentzea sp. BCCO 10_0061]MDX8148985.1 hypothetical protein [Lentzea sp. BCCO 10_0061]